MKKLLQIFREYKWKLILIYVFMLLTEVSMILQPFLLGKSIDELMIGGWFWLGLLSASYFFSNLFGYKRMVYDTKVYTQIYNDIVLKFLKTSNKPASIKVARTDMAHEIVGVLEGYVHYYISTIVVIIGSIGFIYSENWRVGLLISFAFLFILLSVSVFYKKISQAINVRNNHYEKKVTAIDGGYAKSFSFFQRRRRLEIFESTLQGKNWLLVGVIKHIFLIAAIVILVTTTQNPTIGSVITVYSYVNNFLISLMSIPVAVEMYSRISDIFKRFD